MITIIMLIKVSVVYFANAVTYNRYTPRGYRYPHRLVFVRKTDILYSCSIVSFTAH